MAQDPFSWLTPHTDTAEYAGETPPRVVEQLFGYGPPETFTDKRRFDEMLVKPTVKADLLNIFQPALPTRVMSCDKFQLRFRTSEDVPIHVDHLVLFLITSERQKLSLESSVGDDLSFADIKPLYGELRLVAVTIHFPHPIDEIAIESATDVPLLVHAVRYSEARRHVTSWRERNVFVPGQYRIIVEGKSTAEHPGGLPSSTPVNWRVKKVFGVKYPETLRPYIHYTTLGDSRLFFDEPLPWNPTMYGFGFPVYKQYSGLVRFLVPYMSQIFPAIKLRLAYEKGPTFTQTIAPVANPDGTSFSLKKSQDWVTAAGGATQPDEEILFTTNFPQHGAARVFLLFDHPDGPEVKLDEWSCYISQFDSFKQHLTWDSHCLQTYYDATGRNVRPCCPTIKTGKKGMRPIFRWSGNRIDTVFERARSVAELSLALKPLLEKAYPVDELEPYPDELSSPPVSWCLPTAITQHLKPLDAQTGVRFAEFAHETDARFNDGSGDKLDGINDTVSETTVEAVVDSQGRPYALWVRTPEPVDWRRVSASLRIRHVKQTGDCPTGYAHRNSLDMEVTILPSPDASSAFLVGSFAGIPTRLPRGEYELTLSFDPYLSELPKLRPTYAIGATPEVVKMKFLQSFGLDWPLPSTGISIPAHLIEELVKLYFIDPRILIQAFEGLIQPEELKRLLGESAPIPQPLTLTVTPETLEKARVLYRRLVGTRQPLTGGPEAEPLEMENHLSDIEISDLFPTLEEEEREQTETTPNEGEEELAKPESEEISDLLTIEEEEREQTKSTPDEGEEELAEPENEEGEE